MQVLPYLQEENSWLRPRVDTPMRCCLILKTRIIIIMFNISIAQISIWTWSNALYNSRGNQINIAQSTILQLLFTNQIKPNVGFWWEGKTGVPWEKPLMTEWRTNKLNAHMTPSAEIEPGPHWWKASALTTRPTLPPLSHCPPWYSFSKI